MTKTHLDVARHAISITEFTIGYDMPDAERVKKLKSLILDMKKLHDHIDSTIEGIEDEIEKLETGWYTS